MISNSGVQIYERDRNKEIFRYDSRKEFTAMMNYLSFARLFRSLGVFFVRLKNSGFFLGGHPINGAQATIPTFTSLRNLRCILGIVRMIQIV